MGLCGANNYEVGWWCIGLIYLDKNLIYTLYLLRYEGPIIVYGFPKW